MGFDQVNVIIDKLRENLYDRQCILQMWQAAICADDLDVNGECFDDLTGDWRTRPCNTHAYFRGHTDSTLDLTICCRSNDMIFGGYGVRAVHFSILLEYVATMAGMTVGRMYQVSNNFHAYVDVLDRYCGPTGPVPPAAYIEEVHPLISDPATFDEDVRTLLRYVDTGQLGEVFLDPHLPEKIYNRPCVVVRGTARGSPLRREVGARSGLAPRGRGVDEAQDE